MPDIQQYSNDELVLHVGTKIDPSVFNIDDYEPFIDALCGSREYQKEALYVLLRYFLGGHYANLRQLAEENFYSYQSIKDVYKTFHEMERHLHLPDQLSCSIDLATASGKSYVMYGIARIMLAYGAVDQVLVLCPSRTIEKHLTQKFVQLSEDSILLDLLPPTSRVRNPHIINANTTIEEGTVCVENYHAVMPHVISSIRPSLIGKGKRTLVLNDEVHHLYNPQGSGDKNIGRWKEFLLDPELGFHYVAGFSGTCYIGDAYFADVIARYSLRQAITDGYAKTIEYVAEDKFVSAEEKFQKIYDNHLYNKNISYRKIKPLTIIVAHNIDTCEHITEELLEFLIQKEKLSLQEASDKVLIVTSSPKHKINVHKLDMVDQPSNPVEWITSVSMLTEGWDVQNVCQIVPHELKAFNSKLLIAQVLGRGLRIPSVYSNERPTLTIFNHAAWSHEIKHLVDDVMEIESKIYSYPIIKPKDYNFTLYHINYDTVQESAIFEQKNEYQFNKGYITLISQSESLERDTTYEQVISGKRRQKKTQVKYKISRLD